MARRENPIKRAVIHIILIITCIIALYPISRVLTISLRPGDRATSTSLKFIPENPSLNAFRTILFEKGYSGGNAAKKLRVIKDIQSAKLTNTLSEIEDRINTMKKRLNNPDEKLTKEQIKNYNWYKNYYNLNDDILNEKIIKLENLQKKLWYKFFNASFWTWFRNSIIVSFFAVLFGVSFASTAGYAFSRYNFPGKNFGLTFFLITQMFPPTMLLLPMYLVMSKLGLTNTYFGLVIMYTTTALPLCVWQMKGYYDTIPFSLEEAALIDGCSNFQAFYQIILPLVKPGLVVTALFSFMSAWTDFVIANVMMQSEELKTLPLGLQSMNGRFLVEWQNFSAASILVMLPAIFLFMYLSKFLVSGLTMGGVKE